MQMNVFQDKRERSHDDNYGNEDLPGSSEVFPVGIPVFTISPHQGNGKPGNKHQREGNLSVRKRHAQR